MCRGFVLEQFHFWHFNCISSQVLFFTIEVWQTSHENWKTFAFSNICSLWKSLGYLTNPIYSSLTLHICVLKNESARKRVRVFLSVYVLGFYGAFGCHDESYSRRDRLRGVQYKRGNDVMKAALKPNSHRKQKTITLFSLPLSTDSSLRLLPLLSLIPFSLFSLFSSFLCREACVCSHHTQGTAAFRSVITR